MYHLKDKHPADTLATLKELLAGLGLELRETDWTSAGDAAHSGRVVLANAPGLGTNGKGISHGLGLASAYAEFLERLQNQTVYQLPVPRETFDPELAEPWSHTPDESWRPVGELLAQPELCAYLGAGLPAGHAGRADPAALADALTQVFGIPVERGRVLCVPYLAFPSLRIVHVPVRFPPATNGLCAGNTPAEALVQGISELFERHVQFACMERGVVLPEIPRRFVARAMPEQAALLRAIEDATRLRLEIRDGSLGRGLPVVATVATSDDGRYLVKFGAHPDPRIALERCLTETVQGMRLSVQSGMMPFRWQRPDEVDEAARAVSLCRGLQVATNEFGARFFGGRADVDLALPRIPDDRGNADHLGALLDLVRRLGWTLLVRDVGFLGFPSYSTLMPEAAEANLLCARCALGWADSYQGLCRAAETARNLPEAPPEDLLFVADVVEARRAFGRTTAFGQLTTVNFRVGPDTLPLTQAFTGLLHCRAGDLERARTCFAGAVDGWARRPGLRPMPGPAPVQTVLARAREDRELARWKCLRDLTASLSAGDGDPAPLERFHPRDALADARRLLLGRGGPLADYPARRCPSCRSCPHEVDCAYPFLKSLHLRLRRRMARWHWDQERLREVLG